MLDNDNDGDGWGDDDDDWGSLEDTSPAHKVCKTTWASAWQNQQNDLCV